MARQKFEASARTVRRWCLAIAALQLVQAVASWIWVVDTGQRLVATGWALAAAALGVLMLRAIPDSTEQLPKESKDRTRALTAEDWRQFAAAVVPVFFGMLMKDVMPGRPDFWVEYGVMLSASFCAVAVYSFIARRLKKLPHPGSS